MAPTVLARLWRTGRRAVPAAGIQAAVWFTVHPDPGRHFIYRPGSGSLWPLDADSAARIHPVLLATPMQERSLGRGPLAEPTLRWSPWAAGIFPIPFEIFGALRSLLQYLSSLDRWPAMSGASPPSPAPAPATDGCSPTTWKAGARSNWVKKIQ